MRTVRHSVNTKITASSVALNKINILIAFTVADPRGGLEGSGPPKYMCYRLNLISG